MHITPATTPTARSASTVLPLVFIIGAVLFTLSWLALGFVNDGYTLFDIVIEEYSPISQPISGLGLGATAVAMNTAFVLYGSTASAGAVGISRNLGRIEPRTKRVAAVTFGLHGLGSVLVGIFTLEQMPMHSFGFLLVLAPIVGFGIIGRRLSPHPAWHRLGRLLILVATPVSLLLVVAFFATFNPVAAGSGEGIAGLSQRVLVVHIQAWIIALAWITSRRENVAIN